MSSNSYNISSTNFGQNNYKNLDKIRSKLSTLLLKKNSSWTMMLNCDPESEDNDPNTTSRPVKSGHFVYVKPTPLPNPYLVSYSREFAALLGLDKATCTSKEFISIFSGDIKTCSWATPYALSIYGHEMYDNCPFKNDTGYGDGRAISLMEIVIGNPPSRWELQLKGSGKTPFSRTGDGRAVLRSCVREFIASEAMANLGVSTTRALSITASGTERVKRPWFSGSNKGDSKNPDIMQESICAILCRVAPSFVRVGHIELFSRRVRNAKTQKDRAFRISELVLIVEHAIFREYPSIHALTDINLQDKIILMLKDASKRFAKLTADWLRVGYMQGNFHSDNCLVGGSTMDYGPFGYMEKYDPKGNLWTGSGPDYAFINQPAAGGKNFETLVDACIPLLDTDHEKQANKIKIKYYEISTNTVNKMWANKLGFEKYLTTVNKIKLDLFRLIDNGSIDYTIFWRQLAVIVEKFGDYVEVNYDLLFKFLEDSFYTDVNKTMWIKWLEYWFLEIQILISNRACSHRVISNSMKSVSPKFIPREWMLVSAYEAANMGDFSLVNELQILFETPYAEHDVETIKKYYKKSPAIVNGNENVAGVTFMTCSS